MQQLIGSVLSANSRVTRSRRILSTVTTRNVRLFSWRMSDQLRMRYFVRSSSKTMTTAQKVDKIKESFDKHWLGEENVTYERYVFHQRVQQPGESVEDFVADLRKLAKSCAVEHLEDSLIRDRLAVGIRDDPTRRRLLQVENLSLSDAIDACKATEATNRRLRTMNGTSSAEIDALTTATPTSRRRGRRSSKSRDRASQRDTVNSARRCLYCDRQHGGPKESCPVFVQQCRKSGKKNHFQKVCRSMTRKPS